MTRIAGDFTNLKAGSDLGFTESRWNEYRSLFQQMGISAGISRREDGAIIFLYWPYGLVTGGEEKGYVYSTKTLHPVVDSLDKISIPIEDYKPIYRKNY